MGQFSRGNSRVARSFTCKQFVCLYVNLTKSMARLIPISLIQDAPTIWNADHASMLREEYRVVGALVGCLPRCPHQNTQLGLPLKLLKEEAALLIKKGVCRLVKGSGAVQEPSQSDIDEFTARRNTLYEEQVSLCKEQRKEQIKQCRQQIMEGKRQKILEARKASGEELDESKVEKELQVELEKIEVSNIPDLPEAASMVQISTATPQACGSEEVADWSYPETAEEQLRCRIFEDLWDKGYHLTSGAKFGGDFLVYPGDPLHYHSFYIAVCLPYHQTMNTRQLIAYGRLGSTVKKTVLLCAIDEQENCVYTSLEWTHTS